MSASFEPLGSAVARPTLAAAPLPRRVRRVLEHLYALVSDDMARALERMLADFEQQLFRLADHARNPGLQAVHFETLRIVRLNRADLIPRFLGGLESGLCQIRDPYVAPDQLHVPLQFRELRLVDDSEISEESVMRGIAVRHESRAGLALHLLGQRFGVLAGAPAFDAERLPVGPHRLAHLLADAARVLQIDVDARLTLFRSFDQQAMAGYAQLAETMNALLARENILPGLAFVPIRIRPTLQADLSGETAQARREGRAAAAEARDAQRPHTGWYGDAPAPRDEEDETSAFVSLQELLASRRDLLGKLRPGVAEAAPQPQLSTADVLSALAKLQSAATRTAAPHAAPPASVQDVRQALLVQTRQQRGQATAMSREDSDAFELLSLLYAEIGRELRQDAPSAGLMNRLQVPLLRVALQDRGFFVRSQHPARQLLNAVAEAGATWLADDEADPQLNDQLRHAVDHVVEHYQGDAAVFEAANHRLQDHLQAMARKAEVTERRHVEAARGKEKLELAKHRAAQVIEEAVHDHKLPKFLRSLLTQAWSDVLTLSLLRHGEDSDDWRRHLAATHEIVAANGPQARAIDQALPGQIEHALSLVGYHADDASEIARRLTAGPNADEDPASRTELAMKLKARARLGEDNAPARAPATPRSAEEQAAYERLRLLPFGTWFEFVTNQQGDFVRRRLSWFSPVTDNSLFVNQRGQRVGEHSLDSLARMVAAGQARIVPAERGRLVDRAWHAALNALKNFARRKHKDATTEDAT